MTAKIKILKYTPIALNPFFISLIESKIKECKKGDRIRLELNSKTGIYFSVIKVINRKVRTIYIDNLSLFNMKVLDC